MDEREDRKRKRIKDKIKTLNIVKKDETYRKGMKKSYMGKEIRVMTF